MTSHDVVQLVVTVLIATIAGGFTDTISIYLLFRPHEPRGIGRWKIQGALPKNKARLARSIARTVGERLLTPEDLAKRLNTPAIRETFADAIGRLFDGAMERERGPLRSHMAPAVASAVDEALASLAPRVAHRLSEYFRSPEAVAQVENLLHKLRLEVRERPLTEVLTAERQVALRTKIDAMVHQLLEGDELEQALRRFLSLQSRQLATDERPLYNRLPMGFVGALEQGITDYIPVALERLGALLGDPKARLQIERALRDAFDHSVRDLLIHERLLAKLVVTDRTIERLVDGFEHEGFERFAAALNAPTMRDEIARAVREAVVSFLRVPTAERLGLLGEEKVDAAVQSLGDWLIGVARDPTTRRAIAGLSDRAMESLERWTWGDVLDALPAERVAELVAGTLAGAQGRRWGERLVQLVGERLLAQPIGRPAAWLGQETTATLRQGAIDAAWQWVQTQIPRIVEQIQVEQMIEQKVNELPIERVERLIREVSQRELDLIVRIGYVLGGLFGLVAYGLAHLLGL